MQYVRDYYGVPAYRGGVIEYDGERGVIKSADHCLRVLLDSGRRVRIHPKDNGLLYIPHVLSQLEKFKKLEQG